MTLEEFTKEIEDFDSLKPASKLEYFALYLQISGTSEFSSKQIKDCFTKLRQVSYSNISQYLRQNSNKAKPKKKKIKFIQTKIGYLFESTYEKELKATFRTKEDKIINFKVDISSLSWKPSDIPFTNNKIRSNAHFFTKLYFLFYHLENSIRNFLVQRLSKVIGPQWETEIIIKVNLLKAVSIRKEVSLSDMLPKRGDNILYYCLWDDYAKIINEFPQTFKDSNEKNSIVAHLNTATKIRNAIAHNAVTIPKEYQVELTVFLNKFIRVMKNNES